MVIGLVLSGATGVLLVGRAVVRPAVAAALTFPVGFGWCCQGKLFLHDIKEVSHLV